MLPHKLTWNIVTAPSIGVCIAFLFVCLVVGPRKALAQNGLPTLGITPEDDYVQSAIDSVDLDTGNLIVTIPILSYKQRGRLQPLTIQARYNTLNWGYSQDLETIQLPGISSTIDLPVDNGPTETYEYNYWMFVGGGMQIVRGDALGLGTYFMPVEATNSNEEVSYYVTYVQDGSGTQHLMYSYPGSGLRAMDGSGLASGSLFPSITDGNGNTHSAVGDSTSTGFYDSISDGFGNSIRPNIASDVGVLGWTDSIGRNIPAPPIAIIIPAGCYTKQYPAENNTSAPYTFCYSSIPITGTFPFTPGLNYLFVGPPTNALTSVQLPNGTSYTFSYDDWGGLSGIGLPTGGSITYVWDTAGQNQYAQRVLRQRILNPADGSPSRTWTYCFPNGMQLPQCSYLPASVSSMIDPDMNETWRYPGTPNNMGTPQPVVSSESKTTTTFQGSASTGIVLQSVSTQFCKMTGGVFWRSPLPEPNLPCKTDTLLSDGEMFETMTTYDTPALVSDGGSQGTGVPSGAPALKSIGVPITQTVSTFGSGTPGAVVKSTTTSYLWQSNSSYFTSNFIHLPSSISISDGSGNMAAYTSYYYDENNGSPQGTLGNNTTVTKWVGNGSPALSTTARYNTQGMTSDTYDGNVNAGLSGNHVSTIYDASGLYPSSVSQSSTSGVNHTEYYGYDASIGALTYFTDQNGSVAKDLGHTTTVTYDVMGRVIGVSYPDGGGSQYCYTDVGGPTCQASAAPYSSYTTTRLTSGAAMTSSTSFDGLGEATLKTDRSGSQILTSYDGMGRLERQSNPYVGVPSAYVTYGFDALGRPSYKCNQDLRGPTAQPIVVVPFAPPSCEANHTFETWTYTGPATTFSDENRNSHTSTSDSQGRLTRVLDPSGATTYYQYDTLGNLICAGQDGSTGNAFTSCAALSPMWHPRMFLYDGLSRLQQSLNPETGSITYKYDPNGNIIKKSDARGVTTMYYYDALNRVVQATTPVVNASGIVPGSYQSTCFQYDVISGAPASANLVGHLTAEWTQLGSTCAAAYSPTVALTAKVVLSYDAMGRPLLSQQCIKGMCQVNPFTQNQSYDLAGNMTSWSDGRGWMAFAQQFDFAGRPVSVTNSISGNGLPSVLFSAQGYTPAGSLQNWNIGGYLNVGRTYDSRLRVTSEAVTH